MTTGTHEMRRHSGQCACGTVTMTAIGPPIVTTLCYCDDCQAGAAQLRADAGAPSPAAADGGTAYLLFRADRIACTSGADRLMAFKLKADSATRRVVARCCQSPMYMRFDDGRHWVSAYRDRFGSAAPPVEMAICTKFRRSDGPLPAGLAHYPGYPLRMLARLLAAWLPMLFTRRDRRLP